MLAKMPLLLLAYSISSILFYTISEANIIPLLYLAEDLEKDMITDEAGSLFFLLTVQNLLFLRLIDVLLSLFHHP